MSVKKAFNAANGDGLNAFIGSIEKNDLAAVIEMLNGGADMHFRTRAGNWFSRLSTAVPYATGSTPLHVACHLGRGHVAQRLVEKGAEVNAVNDAGLTPLDCALLTQDYYMALLEKRKASSFTPGYLAVRAEEGLETADRLVSFLLRSGAKSRVYAVPQKPFRLPQP